MSFSVALSNLENGTTIGHILHTKRSVNSENSTDASEARDAVEIDVTINGVKNELFREKIRVNFESLHAKI